MYLRQPVADSSPLHTIFQYHQLCSFPSSSHYLNSEEITDQLTTSGSRIPLPCTAVALAMAGASWQPGVPWSSRKHQLYGQESRGEATSQPSADHQLFPMKSSICPYNLKLLWIIVGERTSIYKEGLVHKYHISLTIKSATYKLQFTLVTTAVMTACRDTMKLRGVLLMGGLCRFFIAAWGNFWASVGQSLVDHSAFFTLKLLHMVTVTCWSAGMAFPLWFLIAPQENPLGFPAVLEPRS